MAKLVYSACTSLDGYVADENGDFEWAELGDDVFAFINNRERQNGTYLFGRRMYETMAVWDTVEIIPNLPAVAQQFTPIWNAAEKIVYSTTLEAVSTAKTRLERRFEPDVIRDLKATATRNVSIGGPTLAAHAIRAGLVDEYNVLVAPVIAGGGNPYLPDNVRVELELVDEHRFDHGLIHLRYQTKR